METKKKKSVRTPKTSHKRAIMTSLHLFYFYFNNNQFLFDFFFVSCDSLHVHSLFPSQFLIIHTLVSH